ncbi:MAG: M48 family metallopeptidase [Prevotella sp.]|nr:M48 family metallopeptidase [Prevotella sp.]
MNINGLDIQVEHKNIKNVHLSVYPPDGRVHVSAPLNYSDELISMYVLQKWIWIEEKRNILQAYNIQPEREYISGEAHYFKGMKYRLKVNRQSYGPYSVAINGDYIVVNVHSGTTKDNIKQTLYLWYKEQLTPILQRLIEKWQKILNVQLMGWEIRLMAVRWGSCSETKGKAYFNVELAKKPIDCIEYVVAHELTHLIERTHTDHFCRLMDTYLPNWEELRKKLNEFPL